MLLYYIPPSELNKYFTAFGKALVIAEKFETSCKFILHTALIQSELKSKKINFFDLFNPNSKKGKELRNRTNGAIAKNNGSSIIKSGFLNDFVLEKLIHAIDSRNWLAHEAMINVGYSFGGNNSISEFKNALIKLENHILNIAVGEYICGAIEIEMNDKDEFYDQDQQDYYAHKIKDWVLDFDGRINEGFNILHSYFYDFKKSNYTSVDMK